MKRLLCPLPPAELLARYEAHRLDAGRGHDRLAVDLFVSRFVVARWLTEARAALDAPCDHPGPRLAVGRSGARLRMAAGVYAAAIAAGDTTPNVQVAQALVVSVKNANRIVGRARSAGMVTLYARSNRRAS